MCDVIAWRILQPSGNVVYVENHLVKLILLGEGHHEVTKAIVEKVYRSSSVTPLIEDGEI